MRARYGSSYFGGDPSDPESLAFCVAGMRGTWRRMLIRCEDPDATGYEYYGGRGISVCERWHSFAKFLYDMGPRPRPELQLDRIDNDGNYEPGNCRWADRKTQMRNTRRSRFVVVDGVRTPFGEAVEILGINVARRLLGPRGDALKHWLTRSQRMDIAARRQEPARALAREFAVTAATIRRIWRAPDTREVSVGGPTSFRSPDESTNHDERQPALTDA